MHVTNNTHWLFDATIFSGYARQLLIIFFLLISLMLQQHDIFFSRSITLLRDAAISMLLSITLLFAA